MSDPETKTASPADFIRQIVKDDLAAGRHRRVVTRFPPEPNGYPHIGHAKAICLNFGVAEEFGGVCHLRFDDTNPSTENMEYVEAIQRDVRWLGFDWGENLFFASDYFEKLYDYAVELIEDGKAYVCSLNEKEIQEYRGTVIESGRESPFRNRSIAESSDLFARMRAGEFPDGAHVLRAKIDMASANMKMRDPLLYRIRHAEHYRRGDDWCIYPMYDFAHCLSDQTEGVTHSLCTLEFENNRELYDWILDNARIDRTPRQFEFARLNLSNTVVSKRKLLQLVDEGRVEGWDDPRMPTLSGLRRRGYTPEAIRGFCDRIGVARSNSVVDVAQLEHAIRDDLNPKAPRVLCVLRPLKVVIENFPEGRVEELEAPYYPHDVPREGSRQLPFSRVLYIEREDFLEDPPGKFFRLAPGREVRLRYAYFIRCERMVKDEETGEVVELRCTYDPDTRGGRAPDGRKVKGTIHWVSAEHSLPVEVRLYDRLFTVERPDGKKEIDFKTFLNPDSLETLTGSRIEPSVGATEPGSRFQFERQGYFFLDPADSKPGAPVFNRTVTLRDSWAKISERGRAKKEVAPESEEGARPERSAEARPKDRPREEAAIIAQLLDDHGLAEHAAEILTDHPELREVFDEALAAGAAAPAAANWLANEGLRELKDGDAGRLPFGGGELAELVALLDEGTLSATMGKEVFAAMAHGEGSPRRIVEDKGLARIDDRERLTELIDGVLAANEANVALYREGKTTLLGFFVGQVMKKTGGRANPALAKELLRERLGN